MESIRNYTDFSNYYHRTEFVLVDGLKGEQLFLGVRQQCRNFCRISFLFVFLKARAYSVNDRTPQRPVFSPWWNGPRKTYPHELPIASQGGPSCCVAHLLRDRIPRKGQGSKQSGVGWVDSIYEHLDNKHLQVLSLFPWLFSISGSPSTLCICWSSAR